MLFEYMHYVNCLPELTILDIEALYQIHYNDFYLHSLWESLC